MATSPYFTMAVELGTQAAIRERIVVEEMTEYLKTKESNIFCLTDVKRRVNLFDNHIEVAIQDLCTMGAIEVAPGYNQTSTPYYQFTENPELRISTQWIPGQGYWQQRGAGGHREKGTVMWYGGHPRLHCKHYKIT